MKNISLVGIIIVLLGVIGFLVFGFTQRPSDRQLISTALDEALAAAKEGKPGPVLDFISGQATLDGQGGASSRQIADFVRKNKPDVIIENRDPKIRGDEAAIVSPIKVNVRILTLQQDLRMDNVIIRLKREAATKWGIFPTSAWRITSVETGKPEALELFGS